MREYEYYIGFEDNFESWRIITMIGKLNNFNGMRRNEGKVKIEDKKGKVRFVVFIDFKIGFVSLFLSIKFLIRRSTDNFKLIFLPSYFLAKNIIDDGKIFIPKNSTKFNDNAN